MTQETCTPKDRLSSLIAGAAALASQERSDTVLAVGRLLQAIRNGNFVEQLRVEWEALRSRGAIRGDYDTTPQAIECLQELLAFLDSPVADQPRFLAIKNLFLRTATEVQTKRDDPRPQQYMRILRHLTAGSLLVLLASYRDPDFPPSGSVESASQWLRRIASLSGLEHPELVALHETQLLEFHLLTPRQYADASGVVRGPHGRLSGLGLSICALAAEPVV